MKEFFDCVLSGAKPVRGSLELAREIATVYEAGFVSDGTPVQL